MIIIVDIINICIYLPPAAPPWTLSRGERSCPAAHKSEKERYAICKYFIIFHHDDHNNTELQLF
jgi:hypothetical protein